MSSPRHLVAATALLVAACGSEPAGTARHAAPPPTERPAPPGPPVAVPSGSVAAPPGSGPTLGEQADQTPEAEPPLNVLVITVDSLRADMPWAGYPRQIAPNLTAFEQESVSYTRAYALSSYTAMSMGGFLAGRYPGELQRSGYFFSTYPDTETLFPELLQEAGVRTLAGHAHFYFDEKAGFRQGFDDYRMVEGIKVNHLTDDSITSPEHLALAVEMLSRPENTSGQFFAWFHFMDPHDRYLTHDSVTPFGSSRRDRYDGEVLFTDRHVGKLLAFVRAQPWGSRTAIIISADHGEAFGEHGRSRHGFELWDEMVHVPLMVQVPGLTPRRIDTPRSHIDLAPTLFELLGVEAPEWFGGVSLVPELRGDVEPAAREVVVDLPRTSHSWRRRALIYERHKIIAFDDDFAYQLYDLVDDPGETKDLRRRQRGLFEQMKARYLERVKRIRDICPKMTEKLKGRRPNRPC